VVLDLMARVGKLLVAIGRTGPIVERNFMETSRQLGPVLMNRVHGRLRFTGGVTLDMLLSMCGRSPFGTQQLGSLDKKTGHGAGFGVPISTTSVR
jgi:hypothetical protein